MLSIVIPVLNHSKLTEQVIKNIRDVCDGISYEIVVVDDGSTDDTQEVLKRLTNDSLKVKVFAHNRGVTQAWNYGVMLAEGDIICVINNDVIFPEGFFEKMIAGLTDDVVVVNPRFTQGDDKRVAYFRSKICGFCFMFRKKDKHNFFPIPEKLKIFSNDNWISSRITSLGLKHKVVHDAVFYHMGSMTVRGLTNTDRILYAQMCRDQGWSEIPICPYEYNDLSEDYIF